MLNCHSFLARACYGQGRTERQVSEWAEHHDSKRMSLGQGGPARRSRGSCDETCKSRNVNLNSWETTVTVTAGYIYKTCESYVCKTLWKGFFLSSRATVSGTLVLWYSCMIGRRFAAALLPRLFGKNPRSHHKGTTVTVRTGDHWQRLPVLCHCQLGQEIHDLTIFFIYINSSQSCLNSYS